MFAQINAKASLRGTNVIYLFFGLLRSSQ